MRVSLVLDLLKFVILRTVSRENQHCGLCVKYRPDHPKHAAQAYPDIHFSPPVDLLFLESLLYTSIPLRRNMSARISLRGLRKLISVDVVFSRGTAHIMCFYR